MFPASLEKAGPKHSTSVSFSAEVAVPLRVDEKEVALVPNPVPVVTVKGLPDQQGPMLMFAFCNHVQVQTWAQHGKKHDIVLNYYV